MSRVAMRVEGLGKRYRLIPRHERADSLRDALSLGAARAWRRVRELHRLGERGARPPDTFWALRDVSFALHEGEVLGIIGPNGAGKSTLLKILSRITQPTEGLAEVRGRVGSLLEVGTGFNWELSGRENIFLNGAILGMRRAEIQRKFDEIVAFAEVDQFIDTPVKHYSSGMYLRLAFAVAAHLEPEILIVDEVLAVGDAAFQKKCLGKMAEVSREGRTVLFVSHNMLAIENLSQRVLWIAGGMKVREGPAREVVAAYIGQGMTAARERSWAAPDGAAIHLRSARARPVGGDAADPITVSTPILLECEVENHDVGAHVNVIFNVYDKQDVLLFTTSSPHDENWRLTRTPLGVTRFTCRVPAPLLNDGAHRLEIVLRRNLQPLGRTGEALVFDVEDDPATRNGWFGTWAGVIRPPLDWSTELLPASGAEPAAARPPTGSD